MSRKKRTLAQDGLVTKRDERNFSFDVRGRKGAVLAEEQTGAVGEGKIQSCR